MARVNPESSFEASARHLFRHINDVTALRFNPLVRQYFIAGLRPDESALERVHAKILKLAEKFCIETASAGQAIRSRRQRAIVASLCACEAPEKTAARLNVSRTQYYRERSAISSRIARALKIEAETKTSHFVGDDPLRMLFKRAESLRDAGHAGEAVRILEDCHRAAADDVEKSVVSLLLAEELVFLGSHVPAKELLARSDDMAYRMEASGASEWLRDCWTLNRARLQSQLNCDARAGSALESLARRRLAERRSDDVTFDAVFLAGEQYRNWGRYNDARAMLRSLQTMEYRPSSAVAKRRIATSLLAAYCAEQSSDEFEVIEPSFRDAFELSVTGGTVVGAMLAAAGLIVRDAALGRDDEAYARAHEALAMTNGVDFNGFLGYIVAQIVSALVATRYWRGVNPLLFEAERLTPPGSLGQALIKHAQGTFFMRTGRRELADEAMVEALDVAKRLGNRRIEGVILRDRASALSNSRGVGDRREQMQEAVSLLERYGSFDDLQLTYAAAATVLGERRFARLARQGPHERPGLRARGTLDASRIRPLRFPMPPAS
jgi:hypothetical protein